MSDESAAAEEIQDKCGNMKMCGSRRCGNMRDVKKYEIRNQKYEIGIRRKEHEFIHVYSKNDYSWIL